MPLKLCRILKEFKELHEEPDDSFAGVLLENYFLALVMTEDVTEETEANGAFKAWRMAKLERIGFNFYQKIG